MFSCLVVAGHHAGGTPEKSARGPAGRAMSGPSTPSLDDEGYVAHNGNETGSVLILSREMLSVSRANTAGAGSGAMAS